jgi:sugar transferase (PEP-CTERM/EpsH1 system associated)
MKIFILLSRIPWPIEKGDKLRAWHQIRELSENNEIYLFCLNDSNIHPDSENNLKKYCKEVHFLNLSKTGIAFRLLGGLFSSLPMQVKYFHSKKIHRKIEKEIDRIKPEHIYAQLIRVSEYVKNIHHIPKTLDYMDALSKGMERRIPKSGNWMKPFLRMETKRLLEYENLIFDYFENKTIISEQDRNLIYHPDQKKIFIIPNGVDTDYFKPEKKQKKTDLLFNGNMSYPPNVDCVIYIAEKILPEVQKKYPDIRLLISGANPSKKVTDLAKKNTAITVSGWMNDIREAYASSKIFLAPMQIGTGVQNKLLEAMAMELPCITTDLANNGLGAEKDKNILIGNSPAEIYNHIDKLLSDEPIANSLGRAGRDFVCSRYNWKSASAKLNQIFEQSVGKM